MFSSDDHQYMAQALRLAEYGLFTTDPNPRVGCVVVRDGDVVGEGWHQRTGEAHAEVHALRQAGEKAQGATVYVTLEPCSHHGRTPPCAQALIDAGVGCVIIAMQDPNPQVAGQGLAMLQQAGINAESGLMQAQAEQLNPGFISRHTKAQPYVRCKMAMSLDGRTALASGESKWITSEAARADVQRWRGRSSVIVTGIGTVLADDPRLNARLECEVKQPDRVILDTSLRFPVDAKMLDLEGEVFIATASQDEAKRQQLENKGVRFIDLSETGQLDLEVLLKCLAELQYNEVLIEAGPTLNGAFLAAGLVDELIVYMAPHLMGDAARGLFALPEIESMSQRKALEIIDVRQVGSDLRLILQPTI